MMYMESLGCFLTTWMEEVRSEGYGTTWYSTLDVETATEGLFAVGSRRLYGGLGSVGK